MTSTQNTSSTIYKIDRSKIIWTVGIIVIGILALLMTRRKNVSQINNAIVKITHLDNGNKDFIDSADVLVILKHALDGDIKDERVGRLNVANIELILNQDPFIEKAQVYVTALDNLSITVKQREPICRIIDNAGGNYYLDKTGFRMPLSKHFSARVPIITGNISLYDPDFLKKNNTLRNVFYLVQTLENDDFFRPLIQQISVDAGGEFTLIPVLGDQKIRIGDAADLDDKMNRLKIFYREALPYEGWNTYSTISVKYKGQIVCKKRAG